MNITRRLLNREAFLGIFTLSFGAIAGLVVGIPIIGYVLSPLINQPPETWQDVRLTKLGKLGAKVNVDTIPIGQTVEVEFNSNAPNAWAGTTVRQGVWLRRTADRQFIAYAVYCPHLGCPIHWLSDAKIFLCPCHGSVFNADGTVAGGPAPRSLFTYEWRVLPDGRVQIKTHPLPIAT